MTSQKTIVDLKNLFHAVQMSGIFPDSKTFPDLEARRSLSDIKYDFELLHNKENFSLAEFVNNNFILDEKMIFYATQDGISAENHVKKLWKTLTRESVSSRTESTLLPLPNKFVVPGGRFREIYYWDSYFTMLGLFISGKGELAIQMINNFAYQINTYGFIPNGNRTYFLSRSQPPFFMLMVDLLVKFNTGISPEKYINEIKKEYEFWMEGANDLNIGESYKRVVKLNDGTILNRYWDNDPSPRPESYKEDWELAEIHNEKNSDLFLNIRAACESGWDFSSRWLKDETKLDSIITTQILPVDLNCLIYYIEKRIGEISNNNEFVLLAEKRKKAIDTYFFKNEYYFDYNFHEAKNTSSITLAGLFPLFFNLSSSSQAVKCAKIAESKLLNPFGLLTTNIDSGQQWDAPNGWAPLQWISYEGLRNYSLNELAEKIKTRWINKVEHVFKVERKFTEKYNVTNDSEQTGGGEYPNQDGFGWSNGVYLALKNL